MTINKSQGQTFSRVGIYLPRPCFSHGQLYVAMSRVGQRSGVRFMIVNGARSGAIGVHTDNVVYHEIFNDQVPGQGGREARGGRTAGRGGGRARTAGRGQAGRGQAARGQDVGGAQSGRGGRGNAASGAQAAVAEAAAAAVTEAAAEVRAGTRRAAGTAIRAETAAATAAARARAGWGADAAAATATGPATVFPVRGSGDAAEDAQVAAAIAASALEAHAVGDIAAATVTGRVCPRSAQGEEDEAAEPPGGLGGWPHWPPAPQDLTLRNANGRFVQATYSWLFMPLLGHAMGQGRLFPDFPAQDAPFNRWVADMAGVFRRRGVTYDTCARGVRECRHFSADDQDRLMGWVSDDTADADGVSQVWNQISLYGWELAEAAAAQLNRGDAASAAQAAAAAPATARARARCDAAVASAAAAGPATVPVMRGRGDAAEEAAVAAAIAASAPPLFDTAAATATGRVHPRAAGGAEEEGGAAVHPARRRRRLPEWRPDPYNMTVWNGRTDQYDMGTYSWLYMPLLGHAMGRGHLFPDFTVDVAPFSGWVLRMAEVFSSRGLTYDAYTAGDPECTDFSDENQEELMDRVSADTTGADGINHVVDEIDEYGRGLAVAALARLNRMNGCSHEDFF